MANQTKESSFLPIKRYRSLFAVLLYIFSATMYFLALLSAYFVLNRQASPLKIASPLSLFNIAILSSSGIFLFQALKKEGKRKNFLVLAFISGSVFLLLQMAEWSRFFSPLKLSPLRFQAHLFSLLLISHSLHFLGALLYLALIWVKEAFRKQEEMLALSFYWAFVVFLWPLLYATLTFV